MQGLRDELHRNYIEALGLDIKDWECKLVKVEGNVMDFAFEHRTLGHSIKMLYMPVQRPGQPEQPV